MARRSLDRGRRDVAAIVRSVGRLEALVREDREVTERSLPLLDRLEAALAALSSDRDGAEG